MELSIFLAKVLGLFLILFGLTCIFRRRSIMSAVLEFSGNRPVQFIAGIFELIAGLSLVLAHNIWVWDFRLIITVVGWLMVIESLFYLILPLSFIERVISFFNKKAWYIGCGSLSIVLGFYLVYVGFFTGI